MKILKTITFGMVCLFGLTVTAVEPVTASEPSESVENSAVEETAVNACALVYNACDDLYPGDYNGFDKCMQRGGCSG